MPPPVKPLEHVDPEQKSDEALRAEARAHLGASPSLQLVAELLTKLRTLDLPWWKPEMLRERWPATERMRWYRARADLRQKITSALTGLQPKAARKKTPDFQGGLVDSVIDEGDVSARSFEESFDPSDLVVYGPVEAFWSGFIEKMPWKQDTSIHQELVAWLFDALLSDHSAIDGMRRKPILTAWDARTAIDGRVWHTRMPLEIRVAIDDARFRKQRERASEPFHAASDLSIAVASTIATSIPLRDLAPVFAAAEKIMGFAPHKPGPTLDAKKPEGAAEASTPARPTIPPASPDAAPRASEAAAPSAVIPATPTPSVPPAAPARPADSLPPARPSVAPPPAQVASPSIPPPAALPAEARPLAAIFTPPPAAPVPPSPPAQPAGARLSTPPPALVPTRKSEFPSSGPEGGLLAGRVTPSVPAPAAKPDNAPKPASTTSPRGMAATLIDALAHLPVEEERTNPWDIPSEDSAPDIEEIGANASGKRKPAGKG